MGQRFEICFLRRAVHRLRKELPDGGSPTLEVFNHQPADLRMTVRQFESEISNWATQSKIGCLQQPTIAIKHGKEPFDGIRSARVSGREDGRLEHFLVFFQHCNQQLLFCWEKVIKTAAVDAGSFEDVGDAGGIIAPLKKELARRFNELVASGGGAC